MISEIDPISSKRATPNATPPSDVIVRKPGFRRLNGSVSNGFPPEYAYARETNTPNKPTVKKNNPTVILWFIDRCNTFFQMRILIGLVTNQNM